MGLYVSGRNIANGRTAPEMIKETHIVHLQPLCSAAKPPIIGPKTGPRKGAKQKVAMAVPISDGSQRSLIDPPATANAGEAMNPQKNLKIRIE